jgi:hypothetical protein
MILVVIQPNGREKIYWQGVRQYGQIDSDHQIDAQEPGECEPCAKWYRCKHCCVYIYAEKEQDKFADDQKAKAL